MVAYGTGAVEVGWVGLRREQGEGRERRREGGAAKTYNIIMSGTNDGIANGSLGLSLSIGRINDFSRAEKEPRLVGIDFLEPGKV